MVPRAEIENKNIPEEIWEEVLFQTLYDPVLFDVYDYTGALLPQEVADKRRTESCRALCGRRASLSLVCRQWSRIAKPLLRIICLGYRHTTYPLTSSLGLPLEALHCFDAANDLPTSFVLPCCRRLRALTYRRISSSDILEAPFRSHLQYLDMGWWGFSTTFSLQVIQTHFPRLVFLSVPWGYWQSVEDNHWEMRELQILVLRPIPCMLYRESSHWHLPRLKHLALRLYSEHDLDKFTRIIHSFGPFLSSLRIQSVNELIIPSSWWKSLPNLHTLSVSLSVAPQAPIFASAMRRIFLDELAHSSAEVGNRSLDWIISISSVHPLTVRFNSINFKERFSTPLGAAFLRSPAIEFFRAVVDPARNGSHLLIDRWDDLIAYGMRIEDVGGLSIEEARNLQEFRGH